MSNSLHENEENLDKGNERELINNISDEFKKFDSNTFINHQNSKIIIVDLEQENKILKEKNITLIEENHKLQTELAILEITNRKNEEKIDIVIQENSKLQNLLEKFEEMKLKINNYEKLDLQGLISNSQNENQILTNFTEKIKLLETDYGNEIIELKRIITHLKLHIDQMNSMEDSFRDRNNSIDRTGNFELYDTRDKLIKCEEENFVFKQDIGKLITELEFQSQNLNCIGDENEKLRQKIKELEENLQKLTDNLSDSTQEETVRKSVYEDIKYKFDNLSVDHENLKEELDSEKNKYIALLQMNQDLGKKIIENMKILNENKSEIAYLKKKVSEQQKEKSDNFNEFDENISNYELNIYQEDKKKANEIKLNLEKLNQEQKVQIMELNEKIKEFDLKVQNLAKELSLEKMENENLKEIQKSDIKNISKILSEQSSMNQMRKNEEYINELKISLQNTNKINQELTNQKISLEKEILELKNKIKEHQQAFLFLNNDRDPTQQSVFRDDKSQAAFSRISGMSYMTHNKFVDNKIKDLEDSLIQEKESADNLLKIKQNLIEKMKKSNDVLTQERNKIYKELSELKLKMSSLQLERNTLLESEEFLKEQVKELNQELCELKLNQEVYDQLEEKLEEYQRQLESMVNNYNNPQMQSAQWQQLINENVELNSYKNKYFTLEKDVEFKNNEINSLREKILQLETNLDEQIKVNLNHNIQLTNQTIQELNIALEQAENRIKFMDEENANLRKNIEDNKLIIFSLREKCKDMISKEKEIFKLNAIIEELRKKKSKRVSFGQDIVVEYQKEKPTDDYYGSIQPNFYNQDQTQNQNYNQPYYNQNINQNYNQNINQNYNPNFNQNYYNQNNNQNQINYKTPQNVNTMNNINRNMTNPPISTMNTNFFDNNQNNPISKNQKSNIGMNNNNLTELLKSQQSLYDKYSNELNNLKRYQMPAVFMDIDQLTNVPKIPQNQNIPPVYDNLSNRPNSISYSNSNQNKQIYQSHDDYGKINDQKMNEQSIISQRINFGLPQMNNSVQVSNNTKRVNNANKLNDFEKINNTLTEDVNSLVQKYGLNSSNDGARGFKDSLDLRHNQNKPKQNMYGSMASPMSIFDRILQENAINLDDVEKNGSNKEKKEENEKIQNQLELINKENMCDSIVVNVEASNKKEGKDKNIDNIEENDREKLIENIEENEVEEILLENDERIKKNLDDDIDKISETLEEVHCLENSINEKNEENKENQS